ncbi:MAG: NADPH:quinone oxidoreductase family protein [Saprospiraceae bacterium]
MKAILCQSYGPPENLILAEIDAPQPAKNEVLVQVKAAAVNFADTLIIQGLYQFKPELPFTPGSDVAGIVLAIGEGVKHLKVGDEVFGLVSHGAFAEQVLLPAKQCFPKLPNMDFAVAASFMMAYGTSYYALKDRAKLKAGETLLVLGASGGVGLAAVQLGKLMGAKVIAAASTDEKLALCKSYGASEVINYQTEDLKTRVKALTDGKGADVIYDPVGAHFSEAALRAIAWEGRFLVVGFAAGDIPKIPLNLALLKGCQIVGVFWGAFAMKAPALNLQNTLELAQFFTEGKIKPHIHARHTLAETPEAIASLMRREVKGKVVIEL